MHRFLFRMLVLAGLVAWLGASGESIAQSKKKLGGPVVDLDGMKSQGYEHWKPQKADMPNLYKFALPKELNSDKEMADMVIAETSQKADDVLAGWKGNWEKPKFVKSLDDVTRTEKFKVGNAEVTKMTTQ